MKFKRVPSHLCLRNAPSLETLRTVENSALQQHGGGKRKLEVAQYHLGRASQETEDCNTQDLGSLSSCNTRNESARSNRPTMSPLSPRSNTLGCRATASGALSGDARQAERLPYSVEVWMAVARKRMLSAFPPDHPSRRYPGLTRLGLVQPLGCAQIPFRD
jgi:hypothetical protein